jgi:hypothetical protein
VITQSDDGSKRVGRDLLPAGRSLRAVAGILFLAAAISTASNLGQVSASLLAQLALTVLLCAAAYTALVWILGDRFLARVDPWLGALALILPLAVVGVLPSVPRPVVVGADFYVAVSLVVQAAIGYGGCEIGGIPTLVLRRRYTVYCAFNGVDLVEQWLRTRSRWVAWGLALAAFVVIVVLMGLTLSIGSGLAFWIAYLAFLAIGLVTNRLVIRRRERTVIRAASPPRVS